MFGTSHRRALPAVLTALLSIVAPSVAHGATTLSQPRVAPASFAAGATAKVKYRANRAGTITIVVQRRSAGAWKHVARLRQRANAGRNGLRFTSRVTLTPGRHRVRIGGVIVPFRVLPPTTTPTERPKAGSFLWGVSASAFQSEGQRCASNWQRYTDSGDEEPYLRAVDFRNRYEDDIALAAKLGTNMFRFGVNWACVAPAPGVFDEAQLAYYEDVVKTIVDHGMTPLPTFHHFVMPAWVLDQGGWGNPKTVDDFTDYSRKLVERFARQTKYWLVLNEPVCDLVIAAAHDEFAPTDILTVADRMATAHERAYDLIHAARPDAMVSSNICENNLPTATQIAFDALFTKRWLDKGKIDMNAIDVYYRADSTSIQFLASGGKPWTVPQLPYAMYEQLEAYHERYPTLPLFVSENGMPTDNGLPRPDGLTRGDHLRDNVYWMQKAMADGIPVIGYSYWSLTDNYEWGSYRPRFGLYTVDAVTDPTLERRPTDAVKAYRCTIAAGGVAKDYQPVREPDGTPTGAINPLPDGC